MAVVSGSAGRTSTSVYSMVAHLDIPRRMSVEYGGTLVSGDVFIATCR